MEHCIASFNIEKKKKVEELRLQVYVTDALKVISDNTAMMVHGKSMAKRFADMVKSSQQSKPKTKKEIVSHIKAKFRGQ